MGHTPIKKDGSVDEYSIFGTPAQVRLDGDILLKLLDLNPVGKDDITDIVFVTFKPTDQVGHDFGWESLEAQRVFEETDKQVGRIKSWLDQHVPDHYVIAVTADHGAAPLPEFSGGMRVDINKLINDVNNHFDPEQKRILTFATGNQYLFDEKRMGELSLSFDQIKQFFLNYQKEGKPVFAQVFTLDEIQSAQKALLKR